MKSTIQEGYELLTGSTTGYLLLKVPQDVLNEIKITVDEVQNNFSKSSKANHKLAGYIDKEYSITLRQTPTYYIQHAINQYCNFNQDYISSLTRMSSSPQLQINYQGDAWINFQKKHEYNPTHNHSGIFSYVIWYQIPFYKENEIKHGVSKGMSNDYVNRSGDFEFVFHNGEYVTFHSLNIDKSMEGYMALFPSSLQHQVHPFYTSDDYRITISGNILLQ